MLGSFAGARFWDFWGEGGDRGVVGGGIGEGEDTGVVEGGIGDRGWCGVGYRRRGCGGEGELGVR